MIENSVALKLPYFYFVSKLLVPFYFSPILPGGSTVLVVKIFDDG
jgi:hypothetical protein